MSAANMGAFPALVVNVDPNGVYTTPPTTNPNGSRSVQQIGTPSFAVGQIAVGTSGTLVVAARTGRQAVTLTSLTAVAYSVGNTVGVTTASGFPIQAVAGAGVTIQTSAAVYAVGASAVTIGYVETF